jgi:hypothetical protein
MDSSKKHGIYAVILSVLGILIPILAPFALWQGMKAQKCGKSTWGLIGFILANIAMAFFVIRFVFITIGVFSI